MTMTTSEIFAEAHKAKVQIVAMTMVGSYQDPFYVGFESNVDGMTIKGSVNSKESLNDAVAKAWEKFTTLALKGNPKLLAPQLDYQAP